MCTNSVRLRCRCQYESHDWMWRGEDGGASYEEFERWKTATKAYPIELPKDNEPYYIVDRRSTTRYDPRLGWLHWKFGCV